MSKASRRSKKTRHEYTRSGEKLSLQGSRVSVSDGGGSLYDNAYDHCKGHSRN